MKPTNHELRPYITDLASERMAQSIGGIDPKTTLQIIATELVATSVPGTGVPGVAFYPFSITAIKGAIDQGK